MQTETKGKATEMATRLYKPREYAELMRVTPQYVCRCCADGTIKAFRMSIGNGKRHVWRIPFDEEQMGQMAELNADSWKGAARCSEG